MTTNPIVSDEMIERLKKQEERLFSAYQEVIHQWHGGLLIFAGLAMAALGNQHDTYAYLLIVCWLATALLILRIFWFNRNVYNLMADRHFEGTVSEEQEQQDIEYAQKKHEQVKRYERISFYTFWISTILTILFFIISVLGYSDTEWNDYNESFGISNGYCNIAVVSIAGDIYIDEPSNDGSEYYAVANADDIVAALRAAEHDPNISGVLVRIDSLGGTPVAAELIANALKHSSLPIAAVIREYGTSGGYLAATGADVIFASPFSDVGSIGVSMSYLENWEKNARDGVRFVSLASAPFKDYGDPNKPLTAAERALIERDLRTYHEQFVKEVSENRNIPLAEVARLADGSSMPSALALEHKLIDTLGDQESARAWFVEQLELSADEVDFCE